MKPAFIALGIVLALFIAWIAYGYFAVANVERPNYTVLDNSKEYEVRQYDAYIVAEVTVTGNYRDATNEGFVLIADYIFGNNTTQEEVSMTAPVVNSEAESNSEKIAMTTPVLTDDPDAETERTIAFIMPSEYTLDTLPQPNNDAVTLREVPAQTIAVLEFSWWASASRLQAKKEELSSYLERDGLDVTDLQSARYNPPWTPPFMLQNEIWATLNPNTSMDIFDTRTTEEKLAEIPEDAAVATFAGGCFWCIENTFDNTEGVYEAVSGYSGGTEETAQYYTVASGRTDHREAVQVYYDPDVINYEKLLELFWLSIDPVDDGGQYADRGYQYTTAIFIENENQRQAAEASKKALQDSGDYDDPIATQIEDYKTFFPAEEEHQDYAKKQSASYQRYVQGSGRKK
jgi:methionine-S-sulfoxide reductase